MSLFSDEPNILQFIPAKKGYFIDLLRGIGLLMPERIFRIMMSISNVVLLLATVVLATVGGRPISDSRPEGNRRR